MKAFATLITVVSVLVAGCVTNVKHGTNTPETKWTPLTEGATLSFDANYKYSNLKLNNKKTLPENKWTGYLKEYVESFPPEKREAILDGITRHYTSYDKGEGFIRFEPVPYLSEPYAMTSHIALIGTLRHDKATALAELHYHDNSWVFAKSFKVVTDGVTYQSPQIKFNRDNYGGKVWETAYLDLSKKEYRDLINNIVFSKVAVIRFKGDRHYSDLMVTERMRKDMGAMLKAIDAINAE